MQVLLRTGDMQRPEVRPGLRQRRKAAMQPPIQAVVVTGAPLCTPGLTSMRELPR